MVKVSKWIAYNFKEIVLIRRHIKIASWLLWLLTITLFEGCNQANEQTTSTTPPLDPLDSMIAVAKNVEKTVAGDSAIYLYEDALKIAIADKKYRQQLYLFNKLGERHLVQGNAQVAIQNLKKAQKLIISHPEHHEEIGMIYSTLGSYHSRIFQADSGLYYFEKALQYRLNNLGADHEDISNSYTMLNHYYTYVRTEYDKAIDYGKKALKLRIQFYGKESSEVAECYSNLANVSDELGDIVKAIKYQEQAVEIFEKTYPPNSYGLLSSYFNLGNYLLTQEKYKEAKKYFSKIISAETMTETKYFQIIAHNFLGDCFLKENPKQANKLYLETLDTLSSIFGKVHPANFTTYLKISQYQAKESNYDSAILMLDNANQILEQYRSYLVGEELILNEAYSSLHLETGTRSKALIHSQKMIDIVSQRYQESRPLSKIDGIPTYADFDLFTSYSRYAKALSLSKNPTKLKESLSYFEAAIQILETLKKDYSTNLSRSQIAGSTTEVYQDAIQIALRLKELTKRKYYDEKAYLFAEKSKAFNLLNQVVNTKAKKFAGIPTSVLSTEDSLKREITFYNNQLYQKTSLNKLDSQQITNLKKRLFELENTYESFVNDLEQQYPAYYSLKRREIEFTVKDVQLQLGSDEALIEYYLGNEKLTIFIITNEEFKVMNSDKSMILEESIDDYYRAINKYDRSLFEQKASFLYQELIKPAISTLPKGIQKLRIIPHGKLSYVPFDCLINADAPKKKYLLQNFTLSYHYSSFIALEKNEQISSQQSILVMAPVFDKKESQLPPLKKSLEEATNISNKFSQNGLQVKYLDRAKASKASFRKFASDYSIVHLATHTVVDRQNINLSKIHFGGSKGQQLSLAETYDLQMNTDLLTLSSCESGIGQLIKGEGMMSFTRGFSYSGVQNIICSLWKVNDLFSAQIMSTLYQEILNGSDYESAIRKAKLILIEKNPTLQPKDWAGFILIRNNL